VFAEPGPNNSVYRLASPIFFPAECVKVYFLVNTDYEKDPYRTDKVNLQVAVLSSIQGIDFYPYVQIFFE